MRKHIVKRAANPFTPPPTPHERNAASLAWPMQEDVGDLVKHLTGGTNTDIITETSTARYTPNRMVVAKKVARKELPTQKAAVPMPHTSHKVFDPSPVTMFDGRMENKGDASNDGSSSVEGTLEVSFGRRQRTCPRYFYLANTVPQPLRRNIVVFQPLRRDIVVLSHCFYHHVYVERYARYQPRAVPNTHAVKYQPMHSIALHDRHTRLCNILSPRKEVLMMVYRG